MKYGRGGADEREGKSDWLLDWRVRDILFILLDDCNNCYAFDILTFYGSTFFIFTVGISIHLFFIPLL